MAARKTPHPRPKRTWLKTARAQKVALDMAAKGHTIGQIAQAFGVDHVTLLKARAEDPAFEQALLDARIQSAKRVGLSALQALEMHVQAALHGEKLVTCKKDADGEVIESTEKPCELNGAMVTAGLRALSSVFAQSKQQVEVSGNLGFSSALDLVLSERASEKPAETA